MEIEFHNNLKKFRQLAGLTQADLADKVEVSRQTIIAIEKGDYVPSTLLSLMLAKALEIDVNQLFYLSTEKNEEKI